MFVIEDFGMVKTEPVNENIIEVDKGDFLQQKRDVGKEVPYPLRDAIVDMEDDDSPPVISQEMNEVMGKQKIYPLRMKIAEMLGGDFERRERDLEKELADRYPLRTPITEIKDSAIVLQKHILAKDIVDTGYGDFDKSKIEKSKVYTLPLNIKITDSKQNDVLSLTKKESYRNERNSVDKEDIDWFNYISIMEKIPSSDYHDFFTKWPSYLNLFTNNTRLIFSQSFTKLPLKESISKIGLISSFLKLFWPFQLHTACMNQKLALLGMTGRTSKFNQKTTFFKTLELIQTVSIPFEENSIVYSFDHPDLVEGMNRSGLLENSKEFVDNKRHLFTAEEIPDIVNSVDAAFELINSTSPILYKAIHQLVGCIAFYKAEKPGHLGGTVSSAIGVIWLDPSVSVDWCVPFYAEQIVHEFIHTSLFYAELVYGTYTYHTKLSEAKVISSIRRQLRDYDKSFHAAYVASGLVNFHTRAGFLNRAVQLAAPLSASVRDLVRVNIKTQILNPSGTAMLQSMVDFLTAARLM